MYLEPIDSLAAIPRERWRAVCSVCRTRTGACIACDKVRPPCRRSLCLRRCALGALTANRRVLCGRWWWFLTAAIVPRAIPRHVRFDERPSHGRATRRYAAVVLRRALEQQQGAGKRHGLAGAAGCASRPCSWQGLCAPWRPDVPAVLGDPWQWGRRWVVVAGCRRGRRRGQAQGDDHNERRQHARAPSAATAGARAAPHGCARGHARSPARCSGAVRRCRRSQPRMRRTRSPMRRGAPFDTCVWAGRRYPTLTRKTQVVSAVCKYWTLRRIARR